MSNEFIISPNISGGGGGWKEGSGLERDHIYECFLKSFSEVKKKYYTYVLTSFGSL